MENTMKKVKRLQQKSLHLNRMTKNCHDSESESSDDLDDDQIMKMLAQLQQLEQDFMLLRELYYQFRKFVLNRQVLQFERGEHETYNSTVSSLREDWLHRQIKASELRINALENIMHKSLAERQAARQSYESEMCTVYDQLYAQLKRQQRYVASRYKALKNKNKQ